MNTVNLMQALEAKVKEHIKAFVDNRVDDGQFPDATTAEGIVVPEADINDWVYELAIYMEQFEID